MNINFFGNINLNGNDLINVSKIIGMWGKWMIDENGKLTAREIETETLTVRHPDTAKTGITIADRVTGAYHCAFVANGQWQTEPGACGSSAASSAIAPAPVASALAPETSAAVSEAPLPDASVSEATSTPAMPSKESAPPPVAEEPASGMDAPPPGESALVPPEAAPAGDVAGTP